MKKSGFTPLEKGTKSFWGVFRFLKRDKAFSPKIMPKPRSLTGFTLMEVVVALTILGLLSVGFFSVAFSARNLTWRSRMRLRGVEIARHRIEELRQHIRADTWNTGPLRVTAWTGWTSAPEDAAFQTRYSVGAIAGGFDCRNVTVQVRWNESGF